MKKTLSYALLSVLIFVSISCNNRNEKKEPSNKDSISNEDTFSVKIHRYEKELFSIDIKNLKPGLKKLTDEYSFFISASSLDDSLNLTQLKNYLTDKRVQELYEICLKKYPNVTDLETSFTEIFKKYKTLFPNKNVPEVYTYVSDLLYEKPIIYEDSVLIIALDMYLGKNYKYYKMLGQPEYKVDRFSKEYIYVDCMREIAKSIIPQSKDLKTFVDFIIYEGKILYFLDVMLADTPDSIKIYYTPEQLNWCADNETNMWSFIIERKLMYSKDVVIISKLCNDGPFTSVFSKKSPARVGHWIGWKIVKSFMEKNKQITLEQLLKNEDAQDILTRSGYKPAK